MEQAVVPSLELLAFVRCLLQLVQLEALVVIHYCCWWLSRAQLVVLYYYWLLLQVLLQLRVLLPPRVLLLLLVLLQLRVSLLLLVFEMAVSLEVEHLARWVADGAADQTKALLASLQPGPQMDQLEGRLLVLQADHRQVLRHRHQSQSP